MLIEFICEAIGYEMKYGTTSNFDSTVVQGAVACTFVLFVLVAYLLVRFLQWLWGGIK